MTPLERSRKLLHGMNIRRLLEHSDLPVEIATAIADLCEQLPEGDAVWNAAIKAAIKYVENCTIVAQDITYQPRDCGYIALGMERLLRTIPQKGLPK